MKSKKLFDYEEFEKVIKELKRNGIKYFVFGGFVIDAINNEKNKHEDLDLVISKEDKTKLIDTLKNMGYSKKQFGRMMLFDKETKNQILKIDVITMRVFKDIRLIRGNRSEEIISKEAFDEENYLEVGGIKFRSMPFEWFSLYKEVVHFNPKKDNRHKKAINSILHFCKNLKILKRKDIKRIKSDPKYNLK